VVLADAVRLEQIVWNLVSNALKFTADGGRVEVIVTRDRDWAALQVRDNGHGIEPEKLERIFDMFEQGHGTSRTRTIGGLGIGLAIVRQLVELHRGRVVAASEGIGKGACFTVTLPVYSGAPRDRSPDANVDLRGMRILVVDDDLDTAQALCDLLGAEGAVAETASGGREALRRTADAEFDLVISDLAMPDMDGLELIRALRTQPRTAAWPAIAVTGFGRSVDGEQSLAAGFQSHLAKPLSLDALHEALSRLRASDAAPQSLPQTISASMPQ
jgi:two-component system CheB/CheR fusion protein